MLAYLGRTDEAVKQAERGAALARIAKDMRAGANCQNQLVRIHILARDNPRALDALELLLKMPYHVTPGWLRVDSDLDPLRGEPRFEKLARVTTR